MWANVLTKPLQGVKLQQMRAILMNCPIDYSEDPPLLSPIPVESSTIIPMKPQLDPIKVSRQECVEVTSSFPKSTSPKSGGKKKISWRDQPFPSSRPATSTPRWQTRELHRPLAVSE
jgi:hypothetical protein